MFFAILREWIFAPMLNYRLFKNFAKQDFLAQFSGSIGGFLWLFITPIANILIYTFVFGYVFKLRSLAEFGETEFVLFMMLGYLPWFAFADAIGKSTNLLMEKAGLITKVMFPVQVLPLVCSVIPYFTHFIGFSLLLIYLAWLGYFSTLWFLIPIVYFFQFIFTVGLVAIISALSVFFFLTPIIYPLSIIDNDSLKTWFLFNPMHSFVMLYREIILVGEFQIINFMVILPISILSYMIGGWLFVRIKHAFGDVL
jgi:lipopolysaccharide transport system permease protein